MPPFRRNYRPYWWRNRRRRPYRRRYFTKNVRRRLYRKRRPVRKKYFKKFYKRKLKRLTIRQWQPERIRKCRIQGMLCLFQAGAERYSYNYTLYKESTVPERQPGGGGWSIQKLSLNDLYIENKKLLNWWTKSNKDYNLVRYQGCKFRFYRQPETDYVVNYQISYPFETGKFHYPSAHPERLLMYNKKIIVPSLATSPLLKKTYITKRIKPPKEFENKWYFQQEFCRFPLIMLTTAACDLQNYFISPQAQSNNIELYSLNTDVFSHKNFRVNDHLTFGYNPNALFYLYGSKDYKTQNDLQRSNLIYLGRTTVYDAGEEIKSNEDFGGTGYTFNKWGSPFNFNYINGDYQLWMSKDQPTEALKKDNWSKDKFTEYTRPIIRKCRYNPMKDTGEGNVAKWLRNDILESGWTTNPGPDLTISGFPLWILLWGWYDYTQKAKLVQKVDTDWMLVIHSPFISPPMQAYVFVSESWVNGNGPYNLPRNEVPIELRDNWYPSFQYQKEAIETILSCGPAVCKNNSQIQAHTHYSFYFKWGGAPQYLEHPYDPCSQPTYAIPRNQLQAPEIENPETDFTKELYRFDFRRDMLTKKGAERITKDSTTELSLLTDGHQTQEKTQEEKTKKEKIKTLQQQLRVLKLRKQLLHLKRNRLALQSKNLPLKTAQLE
nr:MAG: ORF1 [TTV-like mini virus]